MVILGCIIVGGFAYFANRKNEEKIEPMVVVTTATKLIEKDLNKEYPPTPREVIKLYSSILKCVYSDDITENELSSLCNQAILLYDEELLGVNKKEEIITNLKSEVEMYHTTEQIVSSCVIDSGDNIITWSEEDKEYAKVGAVYTIRKVSDYTKTTEEFILRKDSTGQWKIVGWRLADNNDL